MWRRRCWKERRRKGLWRRWRRSTGDAITTGGPSAGSRQAPGPPHPPAPTPIHPQPNYHQTGQPTPATPQQPTTHHRPTANHQSHHPPCPPTNPPPRYAKNDQWHDVDMSEDVHDWDADEDGCDDARGAGGGRRTSHTITTSAVTAVPHRRSLNWTPFTPITRPGAAFSGNWSHAPVNPGGYGRRGSNPTMRRTARGAR